MRPFPAAVVDVGTWRDEVTRSFVRLDVAPLGAHAEFVGRITGAERGHVRADRVDVRGTPHVVRRSRAAARADGGQLLVSVQHRGTCVVRQDDREAVLGPSDLAVYDTARPYDLVFPQGDHCMTVLQVPRPLLALPRVDDRTAVRVPGGGGLGQAVISLLASLPRALPGTDAVDGERLVRSSLDLLGLCLGPQEEPQRRAELLLARARAFLEAHADDPTLDPEAVAAGIHVSVGHLHRLYRDTGTTVNRSLLDLRVARCAQDLRDPRLSGRTVADIAARRGFKDAAHFTRAFSARHGMPPSAWRTAAVDGSDLP